MGLGKARARACAPVTGGVVSDDDSEMEEIDEDEFVPVLYCRSSPCLSSTSIPIFTSTFSTTSTTFSSTTMRLSVYLFLLQFLVQYLYHSLLQIQLFNLSRFLP